MTQLTIVTTPQNSGDGTPLATAFNYCNSNFSELYSRVQTEPPVSLVGTVGDTAGMYAYDSTYFYYCFADYDGSTVIWGQISQTGNISVASIALGNSNVSIDDLNAPITMGVGGVGNVVVVDTGGQYVAGVVSATGNVTGNFILGNGSQLTGLPATYSNTNVTSLMSSFGSNTITTTGNITAGNVNGTNIDATGTVSATGNIITAGFFVGNFAGNIVANITNIPGPAGAVVFNDGTGNAAATAGLVFDNSGPNLLTVLGAISATANVEAGNLRTTGFVRTTANVIAGNVNSDGILFATGNIVGANLNVTTRVVAQGNIVGANILTGGQVSAAGNISAGDYLNVVQDVNVGGNITATGYAGTSLTVTGNISGGNLSTSGAIAATGNLTTSAQISATGNITGNYIVGNGSLLTGVTVSTLQNGNSNVLIGSSSGNISVNVNNVSPVALFTPLGQTLVGNLSVSGSVTAASVVGGIMTGTSLSATGNVTAANFIGSGAGTPTLGSATNLDLSAAAAVRVIGGGTFRLPNLSAAQVANLTASNGDLIYNTTVNKIQGFENGAWGNLI
jgi:hypothetical protein